MLGRPNLAVEEQLQLKYPGYKVVKKFGPGEYFGDIYVQYGAPTADIAVNCESCELALISAKSFHLHVPKSLFQNARPSFLCLRRCAFLAHLRDYAIHILADLAEEVTFPVNRLVYNFGDRADYIYFIREGAVHVSANRARGPAQDQLLSDGIEE